VPTDMQAQFMAMMCITPGVSVVTDRVFPDRFIHAAELVRMGADIKVNNGTAVIHGVRSLSGAIVMASDLRASAALVLAALAAEGESEIHRVYHLDRGYSEFEKKLNLLGGNVVRERVEE
jgi:UDP-N-acetylglucosamine 1-carboxyvinyltransferase